MKQCYYAELKDELIKWRVVEVSSRKGAVMATWSKVKQQMEGFMAESLVGKVQYSSSSYRYTKDKAGQCYLKVDSVEVFSMTKNVEGVIWYKNDQEVKKNQRILCSVTEKEIAILKEAKPMIPEERLSVILTEQKVNDCAKRIIDSQNQLVKSDFMNKIAEFLATSIDKSIESDDILLNVFALIDRRMGKSRLRKIRDIITQKHTIVQYFYQIRCEAEGI